MERGNRLKKSIKQLVDHNLAVPICPEEAGGLSTPRVPSEQQTNGRVQSKEGIDVTIQFERGAQLALEIAQQHHSKIAILKSKSPSCGSGMVYDGTFTGTLREGDGVTAELLKRNGITVYTEEEFEQSLQQ